MGSKPLKNIYFSQCLGLIKFEHEQSAKMFFTSQGIELYQS